MNRINLRAALGIGAALSAAWGCSGNSSGDGAGNGGAGTAGGGALPSGGAAFGGRASQDLEGGGGTLAAAGTAGALGGGGSANAGGMTTTNGGASTAGQTNGIGGAVAAGGALSAAGNSATGGASSGTVSIDDLSKNGPYTSTTVLKTGPNNNYTIYRPQQLAPGGVKSPIAVWISGGGSTPDQYDLLPHLATHGFVVIASNTSPQMGTQVALGEEMVAAVSWIVQEFTRSGSDYNGTVDTSKIAATGYSMGGLASMSAAADPRWTTTVHISGGSGDGSTKNLHAPAAVICGPSGGDIAGANCAKDFDAATTPMFYGVFNGGDHLGVRTSPYKERIRAVVTGWLRWQLFSDQTLKPMFVGDQCTVCKDSNWTVKQKNLQ
jgi:dienelactone hydrolase